jgi:hypothetical protein
MSDSPSALPKRAGVAADHGGLESNEYLVGVLREAHYEVVDYGDRQPRPDDDHPDFVVPLARAVARGDIDRGMAICGRGVGACITPTRRQVGEPDPRSFFSASGGEECDMPGRPRGREYVRLGVG